MKISINNYYGVVIPNKNLDFYPEGDCCFGCPYKCCPCRPDKTSNKQRPENCIWSFYIGMMSKEDL